MIILGKYEPYIYASFRIVIGFLFMQHGAQKLFGFPPMPPPPPGAPAAAAHSLTPLIAAAGTIELVCGLLIMLGLFASLAAFLASGTMAVAYFMAHQSHGVLPIMNGGEPAVVYCFIFLYIAARGSGIWSVDAARGGERT